MLEHTFGKSDKDSGSPALQVGCLKCDYNVEELYTVPYAVPSLYLITAHPYMHL